MHRVKQQRNASFELVVAKVENRLTIAPPLAPVSASLQGITASKASDLETASIQSTGSHPSLDMPNLISVALSLAYAPHLVERIRIFIKKRSDTAANKAIASVNNTSFHK